MVVITKNRGFREFLLKKIFFDFLQKYKKFLIEIQIFKTWIIEKNGWRNGGGIAHLNI